MIKATKPTYQVGDTVFEYSPPHELDNLGRYNIAACARERMKVAISFEHQTYDQTYARWRRERDTFWSTVARSVPTYFRVNKHY